VDKKRKPINKNIIQLNIQNSNIKILGNLGNLINLKYLNCSYNQLTSLEEIENLVNLKYLNCKNNQLTSLEGIEKIVNLIKNNIKILNNIEYNFIDSDDFIELNKLFGNLHKYNNKSIFEIEQMINYFNGFQKFVLK
jgi:Leucine-rich repeat (LRR) protein